MDYSYVCDIKASYYFRAILGPDKGYTWYTAMPYYNLCHKASSDTPPNL